MVTSHSLPESFESSWQADIDYTWGTAEHLSMLEAPDLSSRFWEGGWTPSQAESR